MTSFMFNVRYIQMQSRPLMTSFLFNCKIYTDLNILVARAEEVLQSCAGFHFWPDSEFRGRKFLGIILPRSVLTGLMTTTTGLATRASSVFALLPKINHYGA